MNLNREIRTLVTLLALAASGCGGAPASPDAHSAAPTSAPALGLTNERTPFPGILTGGQPTIEQLAMAASSGYRTVVNLRPAGEAGEVGDEAERVRGLGMSYISIPVAGEDGISEANAGRLGQVLQVSGALPALVHCASGNRVGALFALRAHHFEGRSAVEALEIGRTAGLTRLEPLVRQRLSLPPPAEQ